MKTILFVEMIGWYFPYYNNLMRAEVPEPYQAGSYTMLYSEGHYDGYESINRRESILPFVWANEMAHLRPIELL